MLNLDLDSDVLSFVRSHLLSSKLVEPKLILKHPELISSINFGDYVDENIKKSGFFESLLKFYHHGNDETKEKVAIFLCENMESKHPNVDGKYQLKLQPVNVFVKLVSVLREEGKFNNVEILSEFVRKITSSTSRYESLELQLTILVEVIRIGSSLVDEISNSFLIDCMFYAVDDCDLTSFNKARILLFRKDFRSGTIDTQWNRQHGMFSQLFNHESITVCWFIHIDNMVPLFSHRFIKLPIIYHHIFYLSHIAAQFIHLDIALTTKCFIYFGVQLTIEYLKLKGLKKRKTLKMWHLTACDCLA